LIQENGSGESPPGGRDRFHVSLRSDGTVDVAAIAAAFGGGGHANAAGFNIEADMAELKSKIFDLAQSI
jgi:phosphoesterase RecJ-like protein